MADNANPGELMEQIAAANAAQLGEAYREQVTNKCFAVCIGTPSKALTARESTCVERCLDRFTDAMNVVTEALAARSSRGM